MFCLPVVFAVKAFLPNAVLSEPVVFADNAFVPIAVLLPVPLMVKLPESVPTNVLFVPNE